MVFNVVETAMQLQLMLHMSLILCNIKDHEILYLKLIMNFFIKSNHVFDITNC